MTSSANGLASGRLSFESDPAVALKGAELLWVAYDTPVDEDDRADLTPVLYGIDCCVPYLDENAIVLISSQIPAGTCRSLEKKYPGKEICLQPGESAFGQGDRDFPEAGAHHPGNANPGRCRSVTRVVPEFFR